MKNARNNEVVEAWKNGSMAKSGNGSIRTDGVLLWSYNLVIGLTEKSKKIVINYRGKGNAVSSTTSCHVGLAVAVADETREPTGEQVDQALTGKDER